jgi:triacylglycerol lipase
MIPDTLKLVDPQLRRLIEKVPAISISTEIIPAMREGFGAALRLSEDAEALASVRAETITIPGLPGDPDVKAVLHIPEGEDRPRGAVLHLHGGGFVTGDPYALIPAHRKIAHAADCVFLSIDYRLAPEVPFPGAIHDGYAGLAWLFANAEPLGLDVARIGVMGESAGGTLATGIALMARDRGDYAIAFQHLIYPALDDRTGTSDDPNPHSGEFVWTRECNRFAWQAWLGGAPGSDDVPPYAAPARAEDLSGLPQTFMSTAALDLFIDENIAFVHRLIRSGVPTEFHIYPGAYHGFQFVPEADVTAISDRDSLAALKRFLKKEDPR